MMRSSLCSTALLMAFAGACGKDESTVVARPAERDTPASTAPVTPLASGPTAQVDALLDAYEHARLILAADELDGLPNVAMQIEKAAKAALGLGAKARSNLQATDDAAMALVSAVDLASARKAFGEVSRHVVALVAADPALTSRLRVFECPTVDGYNRWVQPEGPTANPYMGGSSCGNVVTSARGR